MDFKFKKLETKFKSILSLARAIYTHDFEKVETSGSIVIEGKAMSTYNVQTQRKEYPLFTFK